MASSGISQSVLSLSLSLSLQTSQVSTGTSLSPNFDTVRSVLKFPFFHLLDNGERVSHVISLRYDIIVM